LARFEQLLRAEIMLDFARKFFVGCPTNYELRERLSIALDLPNRDGEVNS
jgi:hypothetical protein